MYTLQALQILIFLIPGFIVAKILDHFIVREEYNEFGKIIEALIFSMIIYTIYSIFFSIGPIGINLESKSLTFDYTSFIYLLSISIILPIVLALLITNDLHMKIARKIHITRKTSRNSVWYDIFCDNQRYIIINFSNGRRLFGWPMDYSDSQEKQYLYIKQPAWVVYNKKIKKNEYVDLDIDGILITPEQKIDSIEFYHEKYNEEENNA